MQTRRQWLAIALGAAAARAARLDWSRLEGAPENVVERRYRADAQIILLGIPFLHRQGVGGGHAAWRDFHDGIRQLEFAGYSLPERAAGLNRLGFIREMSRWQDGQMAEAIYFGLMTASPEENAEEARKALHSTAKVVIYTAIDGSVAPGEARMELAHFEGAAKSSESDLEVLAHKALASAPVKPPEFDPSKISPPPFLHAIAAGLSKGGNVDTRYTYKGKLYRLWLHPEDDSKAAEEFRKRRILNDGARVVRANGGVQRIPDGSPIHFKVWVEQGAQRPVPLRIEYQAKSYLRLVFEAV